MRRFVLVRDEDATGISGTGPVAQGIEFDDGVTAMRWMTITSSTCLYDSVVSLEAIHGHEGRTHIDWID